MKSRTKHHNRHSTAGFTLVEMMMVITIMALLLAIVVPAIVAGISVTERTKLQIYVNDVDSACHMYKDDYGSFPGQGLGDTQITLGASGSEVLAEALWEEPGLPVGDDTPGLLDTSLPPTERYFPYGRASCFWDGGAQGVGNAFVADPTSLRLEDEAQPMATKRALLYYPSIPGNSGTSSSSDLHNYAGIGNVFYVDQNTDNSVEHLPDDGLDSLGSNDLDLPKLKKEAFPDRFNNYDTFLLVAPSEDPNTKKREYFGQYYTGGDINTPLKPYNVTNIRQ